MSGVFWSSDSLISAWKLLCMNDLCAAPPIADLPRIDVYSAQLQLFHDGAKRRHATCDVLGLVCESLQEAVLVLLAIQADDERLRRRRCHSLHCGYGMNTDAALFTSR